MNLREALEREGYRLVEGFDSDAGFYATAYLGETVVAHSNRCPTYQAARAELAAALGLLSEVHTQPPVETLPRAFTFEELLEELEHATPSPYYDDPL
ncbi:hypothetical protein [Meiothermus granaticius]|uniref:Uncharacterized protein n=1 Tax=Meiothermus granaticius NBRC 107808 TaxID=1227551 RepID=A0A399FFL0_9DEIN|nr:hypothetical protein [Meiothermus granaticius]RIH93971.1 hypothetical protein Mgrana_00057 [Meiothermus granaticius NBRC 107808]GEM88201.1 hypothetical protein MGR01S_28260 [Meiothermus granaticius NBRC 107808]